jgi:hypothetical protein
MTHTVKGLLPDSQQAVIPSPTTLSNHLQPKVGTIITDSARSNSLLFGVSFPRTDFTAATYQFACQLLSKLRARTRVSPQSLKRSQLHH